jgi:ubiquinone/menaquinone biosynthesis C-methylase UbiE
MAAERQEIRRRWAAIARGWEQRADWFRGATMPVTAWMIDALAPQPGHTVLELGAGIGDAGFLAAELIEPGGELITSDLVPEMLSAAQSRAQALGVRNARYRQIDAEAIDQPAASIDGVLCRWGYMLMPDGEAALRETRRVLRSGGRLALAAWTGAEENRWSSLPVDLLIAREIVEPLDPAQPGQFSWGEDGVVAEYLEAAGFVDYEVDAIAFAMPYDSARDWWESSKRMGTRVHEAAAAIDAATEDEIVAELDTASAPWKAPDGSLAVPARTWVAAATG